MGVAPMNDLAVGVTIKVNSDQGVVELKRVRSGLDDVKSAANDASSSTGGLGDRARGAGADLGDMAKGAEVATGRTRALSAAAQALGLDLGSMAGAASGAGAAGEAAAVGIGAAGAAAAVTTGLVAALAAGFAVAVSIAQDYDARMEKLSGTIALAGQQSNITATSLQSDAQRIASVSGQSYDAVLESLTGLIEGQKNTAAESLALGEAGAKLAATFDLELGKATDIVADAFNALGEGDVRALEKNFGFLDTATKNNIITLVGLGQTAAGQKVLLNALATSLHGEPASVSTAFGNAKSAVGDYLGALVGSFDAIKGAIGLLEKLANRANVAAEAIRQGNAAAAAAGAPRNTSIVQRDLQASLSELRKRKANVKPGQVAGGGPSLLFFAELRRTQAFQTEFDAAIARDKSLREQVFNAGKPKVDLAGQFEAFNKDRKKLGTSASTPRARTPRKAGKSDAERTAEKESREAAAAARALAADLATLTRAYDPLDAAQDKHKATLALITKLQEASAGASRISAEQAKLFTDAATRELDDAKRADLDKLTRSYGALGDGAAKYAAVLREIAALEGRSIADGGIAKFEADQLRAAAAREKVESDIARIAKGRLQDASSAGAKTLRDEGIASAQAVAQALGGGLGREASKFIGLLRGAQTGDFTSVGGKLGGFLTLLSGGKDGEASGVAKGARDFANAVRDPLEKTLTKIFGEGGLFGKSLGSELGTVSQAIGTALAAASFGKGVTDLVGARGSRTGGAIGGLAGKATGIPGADVVGSVLGSFIGGAFKKAKTGSAALSFSDGSFGAGAASGNSRGERGRATALAGSVASRLEAVAETLGGFLSGNAQVSVGFRKGKAVVDTSGQNRTKGAGVINFGKGEEGQAKAEAFALLDALRDGAVTGLSAKVASALQSSDDIDKALREAVKVDALEQLLAGFGSGAKKALVDFERAAKDRLRVATKFGFDLVKVEQETARERKAINEQLLDERTGSLKSLLDSFAFGDRAAGSLADRRGNLLDQIKQVQGTAAGDANAATKLADLLSQFDAVSLEANGTAGTQFAADRAQASSIAQAIIAQASAEIDAAAAAARASAGTSASATESLIKSGNETLSGIAGGINELGDLTAQMVAALNAIKAGQTSGSADPFAAARDVGARVF